MVSGCRGNLRNPPDNESEVAGSYAPFLFKAGWLALSHLWIDNSCVIQLGTLEIFYDCLDRNPYFLEP